MKDIFESGMSLELMSEEELREAARQYALELMEKGGSPELSEPVPAEEISIPEIVLQPDPIPEEETWKFIEEALSGTSEPATDSVQVIIAPTESEPETHVAELQDEASVPITAVKTEENIKKKGLFSRGGKKQSEEMQALAKNVAAKSADYGLSNPEIAADSPSIDLTKLKKRDLLEIMLRQGEEIDALRAEVADLRSQLQSREIKIATSGSIAEAALKLTKVFEEAQYAADLYLANIRRETDQHEDPEIMIGGADHDE